jgi:UDP-glucose 4-epimerase
MTGADQWRGCKVLVTGGSGFLGSHLCRKLHHNNADVHATSRRPRVKVQNGPLWWQSDLTNIEEVQNLLSKIRPEVIYHLAGSVGASPDQQLVLPTFHSLLLSTINLLCVGTELGCRRIILAGSLTEPGPQDTHPIPTSPYAAAKWAARGYGRMFHVLYKTPIVVLIPFMTFGPGQNQTKLIPSVILSALRGESPQLASGQWEADGVYVDDVIEGFLTAAHAPGVEGKTIDLGSGVATSVRAVVELLVQQMGTRLKPAFGVLPDRPMEPIRVANAAETKAWLGWEVTTQLESGLRQTVDWYNAEMIKDL